MSAIRDESPNVINLNDLPPFVFNTLADGREELLQDSANPIYAFEDDFSILFGVRQVLAIHDGLQSVADMMIQLRNLPEIIQQFPVPLAGGKQDQKRSECRRTTHNRGIGNRLHTQRNVSLHDSRVNYEFRQPGREAEQNHHERNSCGRPSKRLYGFLELVAHRWTAPQQRLFK
jgi:hypothetical protein